MLYLINGLMSMTSVLFAVSENYVENIKKSLEIFWKGMLAIFIVIVLIVAATYLINRFIGQYEEKKAAALSSPSDDNENK
ncbi:MAG: hypothetical protein LBT30_05235 [Clostridiales bacterium]|jgi:Na+-transporting methylmalonyl-CoA/oxaloacetate decarboxylase gamma subunit|nr:hypothetical protein [Clostridiales bacterium]